MTDVRAVVLAAGKGTEWIQMNPNVHIILSIKQWLSML